MKDIKVYKMNEIDIVISPVSKEETNKWYEDFTGEKNELSDVEELNPNSEGFYDKVSRGEIYEIVHDLIEGNIEAFNAVRIKNKPVLSIWIPFRHEISNYGKELYEPYIVASTEY